MNHYILSEKVRKNGNTVATNHSIVFSEIAVDGVGICSLRAVPYFYHGNHESHKNFVKKIGTRVI